MNLNNEIPVVSFYQPLGDPHIKAGYGNFIQAYFGRKPYFRAGTDEDFEILRKFLNEVGINNYSEEKKISNECGFGKMEMIPSKEGKLYSLVGAGMISYSNRIEKNIMDRLHAKDFFAIGSSSNNYDLFPSLKHFSKILESFEYPLAFIGSNFLTEEKRKDAESTWREIDISKTEYEKY